MIIIKRLKDIFFASMVEMRWYVIWPMLIGYVTTSWVFLHFAGEEEITRQVDFFYWLIVTSSTVGYGDISPTTDAGKLVVAFYVIPIGLSIFAFLLGRAAAWLAERWQRDLNGRGVINLTDHILLIGWNEQRTLMLLKLLLIELDYSTHKPDIVLCVRKDIQNPMPGKISFVKVSSFNHDEDMDRAGITRASTIIIDNPEDDLTMTTALYASKRNPQAHKVAYFDDESLVELLQLHCPEVECTPSVAIEMVAKAAFDPGSSILHHDLLCVKDGQTQFSFSFDKRFEEALRNCNIETLFFALKQQYDATLIGICNQQDTKSLTVNPPFCTAVTSNDKVFYVGRHRITDEEWLRLIQQPATTG